MRDAEKIQQGRIQVVAVLKPELGHQLPLLVQVERVKTIHHGNAFHEMAVAEERPAMEQKILRRIGKHGAVNFIVGRAREHGAMTGQAGCRIQLHETGGKRGGWNDRIGLRTLRDAIEKNKHEDRQSESAHHFLPGHSDNRTQ